jgi:hypothetical protein
LLSIVIISHFLFKQWNISIISITLLVLTLDKFKEVKEVQLENILFILLTLLVLKLDKFKEVKE